MAGAAALSIVAERWSGPHMMSWALFEMSCVCVRGCEWDLEPFFQTIVSSHETLWIERDSGLVLRALHMPSHMPPAPRTGLHNLYTVIVVAPASREEQRLRKLERLPWAERAEGADASRPPRRVTSPSRCAELRQREGLPGFRLLTSAPLLAPGRSGSTSRRS